MKEIIEQITNEFEKNFGDYTVLVKSPGRVNLIGEHTDYNDGFVLPAAIDKSIILAIAENSSDQVRLHAVDKDETFETDLSREITKTGLGWPDYMLGIVHQLRAHGYKTGGFDCVFGGNVPIGAGMSSSAALECGLLFGLTELFDLDISTVQMAQIAQKSENLFVGVQCGIMDQFVSLNGKKNHAIKLDCRSLDYEFYPFKRDDIHIVLCDTQIRREMATSEYNTRNQQCEEGVRILQKHDNSIKKLRDVSLDFLNRHKKEFDPTIYQRCKFVIEENQRVLDACKDLKNGNYSSFGKLMIASHIGLRDLYEVSCEELDLLVDEATKMEGVLGSRMMGGGFGGCTINLVEQEHYDVFKAQIRGQYQKETGKKVTVYQTKVSGGTRLIQHEKLSQMS